MLRGVPRIFLSLESIQKNIRNDNKDLRNIEFQNSMDRNVREDFTEV
jgi:hypothetical protein